MLQTKFCSLNYLDPVSCNTPLFQTNGFISLSSSIPLDLYCCLQTDCHDLKGSFSSFSIVPFFTHFCHDFVVHFILEMVSPNTFIRDNLNAFSFNMLVVGLLDLIVFVALFIMTMPLPDMLKRGYANVATFFLINYRKSSSTPFLLYSSWCSVCTIFSVVYLFLYYLLATLYKMIRSISDHHSMISEVASLDDFHLGKEGGASSFL